MCSFAAIFFFVPFEKTDRHMDGQSDNQYSILIDTTKGIVTYILSPTQ